MDDNPENLFVLEKILKKLDADIIRAVSGNDALSTTLYNEFALIILDVQMPEMNGYEVAEILKDDERTENIPIIFVTAIDRDNAKEIKGYSKGAVDFIFKPLDEFILMSKVRVFLEIYKMKSGLEQLVRERTLELERANAHLSDNNARLRKIVETTQGLTGCIEISSFGPKLLEEFASHMTASGGSLYFVEEDGLRLLHCLDPGHAPDYLSFPLDEFSILRQVLESGKPSLVDDVAKNDTIKSSGWGGYLDGSLLVFPILGTSRKVSGVLTLHSKTQPPFTEQDKEIGIILASYSCETMRAVEAFEALQKSERQYRTLFEKTNDAIFIAERATGRYTDANKAALDLTGRTLDELKQMTTRDITSKDADNLLAAISESCEVRELGRVTYYRPDGTCRIAKLSSVPLNTKYVIGIARDITHDLEVEKQLRQAYKMEAIGTLAGGIAHDFNNILFPIIGYTEMLQQDIPENSPFRDSLDKIYSGGMRAKDLVKQILTFSRQRSGKLKLMKMQPIIKEALKLIRSTIPTTIEIKQDINTDCGEVKADPTQIHQIVMNLATNAYHAMETTGGEMNVNLNQIQLSNQDVLSLDIKPGLYACLTIADTGTGMNKDLIEKIFDPFFTTKKKGKGTGMGLSVVHGIVKSMEGSIRVDSMPGKGTQFYVYLPIFKKFYKEQPVQNNSPIKKGNEKILLVDDEKDIVTMEKQMLERLGYQVVSRTNSIEALEIFRADPDKFDMVITDMAMPNMPGDKLSAQLIKINPDIPILLCTGFSEAISKEKAAALGIKGFLMKPIVMKDFADKIREVLKKNLK
ncbi:two component system sensor histidine kinase, hybrid, associated with CheB and CheR [Desulfobacula toluolica Tol2]|uniref:histidine kinase n=1 Tax=Desulfobacula toluolica (strain DSM 7467 / Tol2) TaxID=651182 RepID=K0NIL2_DESTT|nr:two component system sensor histidine kinase, hybrid, associated with CheB and CheR [Desulfobacula toluolica Tol2]